MTFADAMHRIAVVPQRKCSVCSRPSSEVCMGDNRKTCDGCSSKAGQRWARLRAGK